MSNSRKPTPKHWGSDFAAKTGRFPPITGLDVEEDYLGVYQIGERYRRSAYDLARHRIDGLLLLARFGEPSRAASGARHDRTIQHLQCQFERKRDRAQHRARETLEAGRVPLKPKEVRRALERVAAEVRQIERVLHPDPRLDAPALLALLKRLVFETMERVKCAARLALAARGSVHEEAAHGLFAEALHDFAQLEELSLRGPTLH